MPAIARQDILDRFADMKRRRVPIVGGGAGTGLSAKCEEAGGIDLIIIYNSGRYRMAGRGSAAGLLAYGNANEIVREMALEVLPVVRKTPVLAGVNGTDPFVLMPQFLAELKAMGFSGVQNFPTIGLFDGRIRAYCEVRSMSPVQFAIAWTLNSDVIASVIAGPRTLAQWRDYLSAVESKITPDDEAFVDSLVAPGHPSTPGYNDPAYPLEGRRPREAN